MEAAERVGLGPGFEKKVVEHTQEQQEAAVEGLMALARETEDADA
jgi:hypothetical protein